jgi:hypothetical protein
MNPTYGFKQLFVLSILMQSVVALQVQGKRTDEHPREEAHWNRAVCLQNLWESPAEPQQTGKARTHPHRSISFVNFLK